MPQDKEKTITQQIYLDAVVDLKQFIRKSIRELHLPKYPGMEAHVSIVQSSRLQLIVEVDLELKEGYYTTTTLLDRTCATTGEAKGAKKNNS